MTSLKLVWAFSVFTAFGLSQTPSGETCSPLSKDIGQRVENYLAQRLVSGTNVRPSVKAIDSLPGSCYRKLTLAVPGSSGDVVMYLSPDERFLTSKLYDLTADPQKEVAHIAANVSKLLMRDDSPRRAEPDARITLVEFVDFQCPYCKQFAAWYSNLPPSLRRQTALVFKNLPLPQHPWARTAASYAICANFQSPTAFLEVTDFFFQRQSEINPDNLKDKLSVGLKQSNAVDLQKLEACVSAKDPSQIVDRDISIAKQLNINNTPTLFINGRRVLRVTSEEELKHLLETELAKPDSVGAQTDQFSAAH